MSYAELTENLSQIINKHCTKLEKLIYNGEFSPGSIREILSSKTISHLEISSGALKAIDSSEFLQLQSMETLKHLSIGTLNKEISSYMVKNSSITSLEVSNQIYNNVIDDASLILLSSMQQLVSLKLASVQLSAEVLQQLLTMTSLNNLTIEDSEVTFPKELTNNCSVQQLNIIHCSLTSADISSLAKINSLRDLHISRMPVDFTRQHLAAMLRSIPTTSLTVLTISNCNCLLSEKNMQNLQNACTGRGITLNVNHCSLTQSESVCRIS